MLNYIILLFLYNYIEIMNCQLFEGLIIINYNYNQLVYYA